MCQLNLYMVPNNGSVKDIINVFKKYDMDIGEVPYFKIDGLEENYKFYSTCSHCDCSSAISRLQNASVNSFDEFKVKKKDEDIKRLYRMKELKSSRDYEERVKEFEIKRDHLLDIVDGFSKIIRDYEINEHKKILALNLDDEELSRVLRETVYPKMQEMYNELENNAEYKNANKDFQDFISENSDLNDSIYFNIEEFEKEVIEYDFIDFIEEFKNVKNACREILEISDDICIYSFWQDGQPLEIKNKKEVTLENLSIDDLVFLPYKNLLKITKFL